MLTNPNDLFINKEEISAFAEEYKNFVLTVIREESEDVTNTNNRTD